MLGVSILLNFRVYFASHLGGSYFEIDMWWVKFNGGVFVGYTIDYKQLQIFTCI
mgnify:FL=1